MSLFSGAMCSLQEKGSCFFTWLVQKEPFHPPSKPRMSPITAHAEKTVAQSQGLVGQ